MGVGESLWVLQFEFKLEGLDEVGQGGADLACATVVACEVVEGGGFKLERVAGHELCLAQVIQT